MRPAYENNFDHPTKGHVWQFCKIVGVLKGKKIWVHCIINHRVSVFMYHYLSKVENVDETAAMSPVFNEWSPDGEWKALLALSSSEIGL